MPLIEVCFTPDLYPYYEKKEAIVIIVDILRASSSICTAFMNGVREIIPVGSIEEARSYKDKGFMLAAERDGIKLDFADIGNSPHHFKSDIVKNQSVAYSTTNGTKAVKMTKDSHAVIIGSFLNLTSIANWLTEQNRDVVIFCSGWKKKFNIEDTLYAGALSSLLLNAGFQSDCDSTTASVDLWHFASPDLHNYIRKTAWIKRLGMYDVLDYCFKQDVTDIIPIYQEGRLVPLQ